ncbi:response regulator [Paenibacillus sp. CC-CFT747]|nr:response regulator [Paenibacillus sp. CC-CFT747]
MWNVLLVEDEGFVRRTLKHLISWEEYGFRITGEAANGKEALDLMRKQVPDLVITDIVMPVMDGLKLLNQAKQEGMESLFVMLTCMNEFEYARQALEYGASSYLLKLSMNPESLGIVLAKIRQELLRVELTRSSLEETSFQRVYQNLWHGWLDGRPAEDSVEALAEGGGPGTMRRSGSPLSFIERSRFRWRLSYGKAGCPRGLEPSFMLSAGWGIRLFYMEPAGHRFSGKRPVSTRSSRLLVTDRPLRSAAGGLDGLPE